MEKKRYLRKILSLFLACMMILNVPMSALAYDDIQVSGLEEMDLQQTAAEDSILEEDAEIVDEADVQLEEEAGPVDDLLIENVEEVENLSSSADDTVILVDLPGEPINYVVGQEAEELYVELTDDTLYTFQWQKSEDGEVFEPIEDAVEGKYRPATDAAGKTYYKVILTAADGEVTESAVAEVVVAEASEALSENPAEAEPLSDGQELTEADAAEEASGTEEAAELLSETSELLADPQTDTEAVQEIVPEEDAEETVLLAADDTEEASIPFTVKCNGTLLPLRLTGEKGPNVSDIVMATLPDDITSDAVIQIEGEKLNSVYTSQDQFTIQDPENLQILWGEGEYYHIYAANYHSYSLYFENTGARTFDVAVSINNGQEFVKDTDGKILSSRKLTLTGQEDYTVSDVIAAAHEQYFGGTDGYAYTATDGVITPTKIWGAEGIFSAWIKNGSSSKKVSFSQRVTVGDEINISIDSENQAFLYFSYDSLSAYPDREAALTLKQVVYNSLGNAVVQNCAGANLIIDGDSEKSFTTDANGTAKLTFTEEQMGEHTVTAVKAADTYTYTMAVCSVNVRELPALSSFALAEGPEMDHEGTITEIPLGTNDAGEYYFKYPENAVPARLYAKAKAQNPEDKIWMRKANPWGSYLASQPIAAEEWTYGVNGSGDFEICIGPGISVSDPSNITLKVRGIPIPYLTAIAIAEDNGTMMPSFEQTKEEGYTAYIAPDTTSVNFNITMYSSGNTVTVNNVTADGSTYSKTRTAELQLAWNENGEMPVTVTVSNSKGGSHAYSLTLIKEKEEDIPAISLHPKDALYPDEVAESKIVPLSVRASANGTLSYQWYKKESAEAESGTVIEGATEASYTPVISDTGKEQRTYEFYYCVVTNTKEGGQSFTSASNTATITTMMQPTVTNVRIVAVDEEGHETEVPKEGYTYSRGQTEGIVRLKAIPETPNTEEGTYKYFWRVEGGTLSGSTVTNQEIIIPDTSKDSALTYYCVVSLKIEGITGYSDNQETVTVKTIASSAEAPEITRQPAGGTYIVGVPSITALRTYGSSKDGGTILYQWQKSLDGIEYTDIAEATEYKYTPASETEPMNVYYRCRITNQIDSVSGNVFATSCYTNAAELVFRGVALKGSGTKNDPYLLETTEDMAEFAYAVNTANNGFAGQYIEMAADITLPTPWTPVGTVNSKFKGYFSGGGYTITVPEGQMCPLGLVDNATICNLQVYGTKIASGGVVRGCPSSTVTIKRVTLKSGSSTLFSGILEGGNGTSGAPTINISNCTVEAGVIIGYDHQQECIGSIAGMPNIYIRNCHSSADVYGTECVGGICGSKGQTMGKFGITNCTFDGTVNATGRYVGGIVGCGYSGKDGWDISTAPNTPAVSVQNCYVNAQVTGADYVGGIFGAEPGLKQCWANGIGYIQDNFFTGTVKATYGSYVGGIIGYMGSLNQYNVVENNYYYCSDSIKGIGAVGRVETTYENPTEVEGVEYSAGGYPRSDDPLGADEYKLAAPVNADDMSSGTVTDKLNGSTSSNKNWEQSENGPVISSKPVMQILEVSGDYRTEFYLGEELDLTGMVLTATWSDDSTTNPTLDEVIISGYDNTKRGQQILTITLGAVSAEITVSVLKKSNDTINVSFTLLGDEIHDSDEDGEIHALFHDNLETWIPATTYEVDQNATVKDVFEMALSEYEMAWRNPTGNYVEAIFKDGIVHNESELAEFTNGKFSGWMYTLNGYHPDLGVQQQYLEDGDVIIFHYTDDYNLEHEHKWSAEWNYDASSHWHSCVDWCPVTDNSEKDGYGAHTAGDWIVDNAATGAKHKECTVCGYVMETAGSSTAHSHLFGSWTTLAKATVFAPETQKRTCACGISETRTVGTKLTPTITLNATKFPMKVKQTTKKLKVSGLAEGDYVKSWKSSNTKVVKVTSKGVIKAQKKTGKATITVTLASGKTAKVKVTVKKAKVKTTKITGVTKKLTLTKGQKYSLAAELTPITSQDKLTYTSSNKKVATVTKKGQITAKKKGTATITVKAGTKKVKCKVTVK